MDLTVRSDKAVDSVATELANLSHALHDDPEVAFQEARSSKRVADLLRDNGFSVEQGYVGLPTAFRATYGSGSDVVTICSEYDALPGIGHACGHNIIAASGAGAGIGLASVADELGVTVEVLGTPAEERGAGKSVMIARGAWDDSLISLMVHPGPQKNWDPTRDVSMIGKDRFRVTYTGLSSHAAAAPERAINAADAATLAQVAIGLMRQQLPDGVRVSCFVSEGGEVTNIIPAVTVLEVEARAQALEVLEDVKQKLMRCFEGAAMATGCEYAVEESEPRCEPLLQSPILGEYWNQSMESLGRVVSRDGQQVGGSTDMGNVSQRVVSLHPMIGVPGTDAPIHTVEFASATDSEEADALILDASKALARTVILALGDSAVREQLRTIRNERPTPSSY